MPIFEVDGQQFEVEDKYVSDFAKKYPNAVTKVDSEEAIYEVSASDYPAYLDTQRAPRRVVPEKTTIPGSHAKPYQITPEEMGFENVLDKDNFQERYGVSPIVMERQTDPIKESVQRLRAKVGSRSNIPQYPIGNRYTFGFGSDYANKEADNIASSQLSAATENELRGAEKAQSKDGFWKSFGKGLKNEGMWTQGLTELDNNLTLAYIAKKAEKEGFDKLPEKEQDLLTASALRIASEAAYSDEKTALQIAGMSTAESIPYMLQFMLTSSPASLATSPVRSAIKKAAEKAIKSGISSKLIPVVKGAARTAAVGAKATAMTAMQPTMYSDMVSRGTGRATLENGQYAGMEEAESAPIAAYKAFANATIENLSEHSGSMLSGATKAAGNVLKKVPALGGFISNVQKNNVLSGVNKMMKAVGFNGAPEEFFEEQVSTGLNSLLVGDSQFSDFVNWKQQLATLISVGATAGAMTTTGTIMSVPYKKEIKRKYEEATDKVYDYFTPEEFDQFSSSLSRMDIDSRPDFIAQVSDMKGFAPEQIYSLVEFATRQAQFDGYAGAVSDYIEDEKVRAQEEIDRVSNKNMGEVIQVNGFGENPVNIVGGFVVFDDEGFVDKKKSSQTIYYLDEDGKRKMASPDKFGELVSRKPLADAYAEALGNVENDILIQEENELSEEDTPEQAQQDAMVLAENGNQVETPDGVGTISQVEQDENAAIVTFQDGRSKRYSIATLKPYVDPNLQPVENIAQTEAPISQTEIQTEQPLQPAQDGTQVVEQPAYVFPVDKEGNIDYTQINEPEQYAQALQQEFEGDAVSVIDEQIQSAQSKLEKAGKNTDAIKKRRAMKAAQMELDRLNNVKSLLTPSEQIVNETIPEIVENEETSPSEQSNVTDLSQLTEPERRRYVVDNSTDPIELAEIYEQSKDEVDYAQMMPWEAALVGRKVSKDSFIENSDKNNITGAMSRSWFSKDGKSLDVLAQELSEFGVPVTEQDIVNFMMSHPGNSIKKRSQLSIDADRRFKETVKALTGQDVGGVESSSGKLILAGLRAGQRSEQERQALPFSTYTIPDSVLNFFEETGINPEDFNTFEELRDAVVQEQENGTFVFPLGETDLQIINNIINHGIEQQQDYANFAARVEKAGAKRAAEQPVLETAEGAQLEQITEAGTEAGTTEQVTGEEIEYTPEEIAEIESQLEVNDKKIKGKSDSELAISKEARSKEKDRIRKERLSNTVFLKESDIDWEKTMGDSGLSGEIVQIKLVEYRGKNHKGEHVGTIEVTIIDKEYNRENGLREDAGISNRYEAFFNIDPTTVTPGVLPLPKRSAKRSGSIIDAVSEIALEQDIRDAEKDVNTTPTESQKEAGNYKMGHVNIQGLDVSIEIPKGSQRSGKDDTGKEWSVTLNNSYGYIKGTRGKDGDHVDVFIGDNPSSENVFVIDQINKDGSFDEHKVMLGFNSQEEAEKAYLSNYSEGWSGMGNVTPMTVEEFKSWVKEGVKEEPAVQTISEDTPIQESNSLFTSEESSYKDESDMMNSEYGELSEDDKKQIYEVVKEKIKERGLKKSAAIQITNKQKVLDRANDVVREKARIESDGAKASAYYEYKNQIQSYKDGVEKAGLTVEESDSIYAEAVAKVMNPTNDEMLFRDGNGNEPMSYKFDNENCEYHVRFSDHINEDLKRGWSSWNFGAGGFEGTEEELNEAKKNAIDNEEPFTISEYELWGKDIKNADIRELYPNYWVLVDNENARGGLSSHALPSNLNTLGDAVSLVEKNGAIYDGTGDGQKFESSNARVIYSKGRMHIIEVGDNQINGETKKDEILFKDGPSETEQIKAESEKNGTFMKAPNGKPSNLNEKQWLQVRTKAFKEWFGDWETDPQNSSKVVDENGEPLVVYHGTRNDFYTFDSKLSNPDNEYGKGYYFTDNENAAEKYSNADNADRILSVESMAYDIFYAENDYTEDDLNSNDFDAIEAYNNAYDKAESLFNGGNDRIIQVFLNIRGTNDGVVDHEFGNKYPGLNSEGATQYVVKKSNQIKSATDNTGEFNPNNDDIRFRDAEVERLDKEYMDAVESGDMEKAQRIVDQVAKKNGYVSESEYRLSHRAPHMQPNTTPQQRFDEGRALSIEDMANGYLNVPEEFFDARNGAQWYGYNTREGMESYRSLMRAMREIKQQIKENGKVTDMPKVTVYRAVSKEVKEGSVRNGDWVSLSESYAKSHGTAWVDGPSRVIKEEVPADQIWWDGNDINEFGVDDGKGYSYKNTKNNKKLNETVTRDDEGNIIPPSKRFNSRSSDVRFREGESTKEVSNVEKEATTLADSLNTPIRVVRDVNEITNEDKRREKRMRSAKGWYDPKTGEVVIVLPNAESVGDVQATILHEVVGHKGLRGLFGDKFEEMMDKIYKHLPKKERQKIMSAAMDKYKFDYRTATEEYLAEFVERDVMEPSLWQKIKSAIKSFFRNMGVNLEMSDPDIAYLLWKSKNRLQGGDALSKINSVAKDLEAKERFREAPYTEADVLSDQLDDASKRAWESLSKDQRTVHEMVNETAELRKGVLKYFPTKEGVKKSIYELTQGLFDNAVSLKALQNLVNEVSNEPIESYANPYQFLTTIPARNEHKMKTFVKTKFSKIGQAIKEMGVPQSTVQVYAYLKHGIERNRYMRGRDIEDKTRKLQEEAEKRIDPIRDSIEYLSQQLETADKKNTKRILAKIEGYNQAILDIQSETQVKASEYAQKVEDKDYSGVFQVADLFIQEMEDRKMTVAQIESAIEQFEKEHDTTNFWEAVNGATKWTVQNEFEMGRISKEFRDKLFSMYKYYIPLKGWEKKNANEEWDYNESYGAPSAPIKKAGGRKTLASNLFENIGVSAQSSVMGGHKNLLKLHALRMVRNYPSKLYRVSEAWVVDEGDNWVMKAPEYSENAETYAENVAKFEEEMNELKEQGLAKKVMGKLDLDKPITKYEAKEHEILVFENGKPYVIYINDNPDIARAINLTSGKPYEVGGNDPSGKNGLKWAANQTMRLMRFTGQNLTSRNPAFVAANLLMDTQWAIAAASAKEGSAYAKRLVGNYMSSSVHASILRGVRGKLDESNPMDKMFADFQRAGGETGYSDLFKLEDFQKMLKEGLNEGTDWRKIYTWYTGSIDMLNRWAELASRFSTFVTSRNSGRDIERSAYDAKEITLNFNRKGTGAFLGNWLKFAYLFAGAGLQGAYSMANLALSKRSQKRITMVFAGMAMLGLIIPLINDMFLGGDDDELYSKKPDYERKSNFLIRIPGSDSFFKLPISQPIRPFYNIGETLYQMVKGNRNAGEGTMDIIGGFGMLLPFDPFGGSSLMPSAFQPIYQIKENKDFFGQKIFKDDSFTQYDPEFKRAFSNTSPAFVELTRALNEITGGDEVTRGMVNVNPAILEHLVEGYLGGAFKFVNDIGKQVNGAIEVSKGNAYPYDSRSYPIVGRFYTNTAATSDINAEYYKVINDSEELNHRVRKYQELGRKGDQEAFEKSLELMSSPEYKKAIFVKAFKKRIDNLKKTAKDGNMENNPVLKDQERELKIIMLNEIEKLDEK